MNTGHDGTSTTIHASSTEGEIRRLAALSARASGQINIREAEEEVRACIGVVIQLARLNGQRSIADILHMNP